MGGTPVTNREGCDAFGSEAGADQPLHMGPRNP